MQSWSKVQDVYYPKRVAYSKHGKALHTVEYTQIVANNRIDDALFAMPEIDKKINEAGLRRAALQVFLIRMRVIDYSKSVQFNQDLENFCALGKVTDSLSLKVSEILQDVRDGGDLAVLRYTEAFDGAKLTVHDLLVSSAELHLGTQSLSEKERLAIMEAIEMVQDFHQHTLPKNWQTKNKHGAQVGSAFTPWSGWGYIYLVEMCLWYPL